MKKTYLSLLVAPILAMGFITGCSGNNDSKDTENTQSEATDASDQAGDVPVDRAYEGELPEVSGEWGKSVTIKPASNKAEKPETIVAKTIIQGDGDEVGADDIVSAHYHGLLWEGDVFDSTFDRAVDGETSMPIPFSLNQVVQGWKYGLAGQHVGDRVLLVIPAEYGYGEQGAGDKIPGDATLVFVVDIADTANPLDTSSLGKAKETKDRPPAGLAIEGPLGAKPSISFDHDAKAPNESVVVVLAEGNGPKIEKEDTVVYHMTASKWGQGDQAQSTWDLGQAEYPGQPVGNEPGLAGTKVGSRVMLIQPNTQNPEDAGVFVLDILDKLSLAPVR